MRNLDKCDGAVKALTHMGYKMVATFIENGKCRHLYRVNFLWAVSDMSGDIMQTLSEKEARAYFNGTFGQLDAPDAPDDLDDTLKELEKNLKIIAKNFLLSLSDFINKQIDRVS